MKKAILLAGYLGVLALAFQSTALADTIRGTVKSVDTSGKKLEIDSEKGFSWVAYASSTKWPAGVTDPSTLVGKKVNINKDDLLENARSVEEI